MLVQVSSLGQFARIDVLDDGPGIPLAERQQLFERFYRLASTTEQGIPGSGLGLAIAKSVVDAHNGHHPGRRHPGLVDHLPHPPAGAVRRGRRRRSWLPQNSEARSPSSAGPPAVAGSVPRCAQARAVATRPRGCAG